MNLSYYVPSHRVAEFKEYLASKGYSGESISEDNIRECASCFIYGDEKKEVSEVSEVKKEKSEQEVFGEVIKSKFSNIVWDDVDEVVWMPAVTKDTSDSVFSIELWSLGSVVKRLVLRNKDKSLRFLAYLSGIFIKEIDENGQRNIHSR